MPGRTMSRVAAATFTVLLLAVSASAASASSPVRFGAKLTTNTQPSNSVPADQCPIHGQSCTRVMSQAYGRTSPKAPKDGTIAKIRLIAGESGSLTVYIAKIKDGTKAKVVRKGPTIHYTGQPDNISGYKIESFNVSLHVNKGEVLAFKSSSTSVLRCDSGGNRQLIFQPKLDVGDPYQQADDTDGCFMLIEAQYQ